MKKINSKITASIVRSLRNGIASFGVIAALSGAFATCGEIPETSIQAVGRSGSDADTLIDNGASDGDGIVVVDPGTH